MAIRVLTVDDHSVVRSGIAAMLATDGGLEIVGEAADGAQAVAMYLELRPNVVLMDLRMPGLDGVAATRSIRAADSGARVIALTMYDGDTDIFRALDAGACGYLLKDVSSKDLVAAIRSAAAGRRVLPPVVARTLAEYTPRVDLTTRELEVLQLVAKGLRNKAVARLIGRTVGTVKVHLKNIHWKLGVTDRTEAVTHALRRGIIHLDD